MQAIRSIIFFIGQVLITVVYFPITLLAVFLPDNKKLPWVSGWNWLVIKWLKISCGLDYSIKGLDKLPKGPFVALVNHQSAWETIALLFLLPPHSWVLKKELLRIPVFGWGLAMTKPIAIDRQQNKAALKQLLSQGRQRFDAGLAVVICPQGTRRAPGDFGKFNVGGAMLAVKNQVPVVPICHNAGSYWPKNSWLKKSGTIEVIIGDPISTAQQNANEINEQAKNWVEQTLTELESGEATDKATRLENIPGSR